MQQPRAEVERPPVERPWRVRSGLIIRDPYVSQILDGKKTWEIRGKRTTIRGRIGLIKGGSGTVVGTCDLFDVVGPLTLAEYRKGARRAGSEPREIDELPYDATYAWVLRHPVRLPEPVRYAHPSGAVIWVNLAPRVTGKVAAEERAVRVAAGNSR